MHCANGDVQTRLTKVAYVPGVMFVSFALYAVIQMNEITPNPEGVQILDGELAFPIRGAGPYVKGSSIYDVPIAAAVIFPGQRMRLKIDDLHVSLAGSYADTLRATARHMSVKVFADLVSFCGCSEAKGKRMVVSWTTGCRSTCPLERTSVDLFGKRPTSVGAAQYLMMVMDYYSRMGWPYFLERKSDVTAVLEKFSADVNARGVPSTVEFARSDNGIEFVRTEFVDLLDRHRMRCE